MNGKNSIGQFTKDAFNKLSKDELWCILSNLQMDNERLRNENLELKELKKLYESSPFTPSSEQMMYLFQEVEALDEMDRKNLEKIHVDSYEKAARKKRECTQLPAGTPVYDVDHTEGSPDTIELDGILFNRIEDKVVEKVATIPASQVIERHHYAQYAPADVYDKSLKHEVRFLNPVVDKIAASPSFIADIVIAKYDDALPLYRQEEIYARNGFKVSRQKMAGWVIKFYEQLLPLERLMKKRIYSSNLVLKDETPITVLDLKGPNGKPSKNQFMHVTVGSSFDDEERRLHELVLFEYKQGRSIPLLVEDLKNFNFQGYLMSDGLKGYRHYDEAKHANCWVHAVRQIKKVLQNDKNCKQAKVLIGLFQQLYKIEDKYRDAFDAELITKEEFLEERKFYCTKVIDNFIRYAYTVKDDFSASSMMGKGLQYIFDYQHNLPVYLDVFEATPDNNRCERCCRTFAIGRRNWLFTQTVDGADASAFFYSLIETAKRCNISPYDYIEYVCTFGPYAKTEDDWNALLPWNADLAKITELRTARISAKPDLNRDKPYILTGFSR